jgi:hypothetical protein
VLARDYPLDHELIIYRSATLPIQQSRIERIKLGDLPQAKIEMADTVVVPPARPLQPDTEIRARLAALDLATAGEVSAA